MLKTFIKKWRIKTSLKSLEVDVSTEDNLIVSLQNKTIIRNASNLVDEPRILLCCYMIVKYPQMMLSLDVYDYYLQHKAKKLLDVLEILKKNYSWSCFALFQLRFQRFKTYFNNWKEKDVIKISAPIVHEYWELEALKEKFKDLPEEQVLVNQQEMLLKRLNKINKNVNQLLEKYKDNAPSLEETIAESFYHRWIKDLYNDLKNQNYIRVVPLIDDIKNMIKGLVPNNTKYCQNIDNKIDTNILNSMILNTNIDSDYVYNMILFIMNTIKELQSADMDEDTIMVISLITDMFKKKFTYAQILTFFFQSAFYKLELIKSRINQIKNKIITN